MYFIGPQGEIQTKSFKATDHIIHKTKNLKNKDNASKYLSMFCQKKEDYL